MRKLAAQDKALIGVTTFCAIAIPTLLLSFRHAAHPPADVTQGVVVGFLLGLSIAVAIVIAKKSIA